MLRMQRAVVRIALAAFVVSTVALLDVDAPSAAQSATPAPIATGVETADAPGAPAAPDSEDAAPSTMPSAGVGSGMAAGGSGPLALGALVGAIIAGAAGLRERLKSR